MKEDYGDEFITEKALGEALVLSRSASRQTPGSVVSTNVPHLVTHHSPDGYEWGYGGSGPADLALNICEWYLRKTGYQGQKTEVWRGECFSLAYALHQDLKRDLIAVVPEMGMEIPFNKIEKWFKIAMEPDLLDMYEITV